MLPFCSSVIIIHAFAFATAFATPTKATVNPSPAARWAVFLAADATADEEFAARELSGLLANASGSAVPISHSRPTTAGTITYAVGYGASVKVGISPASLEGLLGNESYLVSSNASGLAKGCVVATGGSRARRGALYAVYHYLNHVGFRFFAPTETVLPAPSNLLAAVRVPIHAEYSPPIELRSLESFETNGGGAPQQLWPLRNRVNGDEGQPAGGSVVYASPPGSVHTSYALLEVGGADLSSRKPPPELYDANPDWFWPRDSPNTYGQLCWHNSSLVDHITKNVKQFLRQNPSATIISVSQNDNRNYCQSPAEMKIIQAEGSPMGPLLRAVNKVADSIKDEFPHIAVDTLAYQYTRPAPSITIPRKNVIIRLCSIECNFAAALTDPSNAPFQHDMDAWSKISNRTYIWDYVVNFGAYVMP
jgi:hypothetical protein